MKEINEDSIVEQNEGDIVIEDQINVIEEVQPLYVIGDDVCQYLMIHRIMMTPKKPTGDKWFR